MKWIIRRCWLMGLWWYRFLSRDCRFLLTQKVFRLLEIGVYEVRYRQYQCLLASLRRNNVLRLRILGWSLMWFLRVLVFGLLGLGMSRLVYGLWCILSIIWKYIILLLGCWGWLIYFLRCSLMDCFWFDIVALVLRCFLRLEVLSLLALIRLIRNEEDKYLMSIMPWSVDLLIGKFLEFLESIN